MVDLVVDPVRELNVLTTSICPADKRKNPDEVGLSAGVGLLFDEVFEQAVPTMAGDFDSLDYGLVDLAYADTVEEMCIRDRPIHQRMSWTEVLIIPRVLPAATAAVRTAEAGWACPLPGALQRPATEPSGLLLLRICSLHM